MALATLRPHEFARAGHLEPLDGCFVCLEFVLFSHVEISAGLRLLLWLSQRGQRHGHGVALKRRRLLNLGDIFHILQNTEETITTNLSV